MIKKGNILREKRIVQNLTQQQVADRAGIKVQQYQKFESNERNIMTASFRLACKVIEILGMNASDFFRRKYVISVRGKMILPPMYNLLDICRSAKRSTWIMKA